MSKTQTSTSTFDVAYLNNGEIQIHRAGCADLLKAKYARANIMRVQASNLRDIVLDIYPAEDFGYDADTGWESYSDCMRIIDCAAKHLH